jgi:hypothetical protein
MLTPIDLLALERAYMMEELGQGALRYQSLNDDPPYGDECGRLTEPEDQQD